MSVQHVEVERSYLRRLKADSVFLVRVQKLRRREVRAKFKSNVATFSNLDTRLRERLIQIERFRRDADIQRVDTIVLHATQVGILLDTVIAGLVSESSPLQNVSPMSK